MKMTKSHYWNKSGHDFHGWKSTFWFSIVGSGEIHQNNLNFSLIFVKMSKWWLFRAFYPAEWTKKVPDFWSPKSQILRNQKIIRITRQLSKKKVILRSSKFGIHRVTPYRLLPNFKIATYLEFSKPSELWILHYLNMPDWCIFEFGKLCPHLFLVFLYFFQEFNVFIQCPAWSAMREKY